MVKQILLPLLAVMAFIVIVGIFVKKSTITQQAESPKEVTIGNSVITVEIAKTKDERTKGLSERLSLAENSGMLFVFDSKDVVAQFWMKDMLIPLDIIWINDDKIVKIDKNAQAPATGTPDGKLKIYTAPVPIDYVLEVSAGFADKNGVKVGDSIILPTL